MKVFLHVGLEKTGTTTIQYFLDKNREALEAQGWFFPSAMGPRNNRKLPVAAYNANRRDDFTRRHNLNTAAALSEYQKRVINELSNELKTKKIDNVVFSSEQIQSRLTTIEELQRLREILSRIGADEIFIVIYLRDPAEIANSNYSTWIRCGDVDEHPPGPSHPKFETLCNHQATMEKFEEVFGASRLIVRLYEPTLFRNGSLLEDFIHCLGCPWRSEYAIPRSSNEALSPLGLELLRRFNKLIPVFIDEGPNPIRGDIITFINSHFTGGTRRYVMPASLVNDYRDAFRESNEFVRARWFPHRTQLFEDKPTQENTATSLPSEDLDSIADFVADIWRERQEAIAAVQPKNARRILRQLLKWR